MFSLDFQNQQIAQLRKRRKNKLGILKSGGQQALSHSYQDITRIDFALKRIKEGQYGLCTNCGRHIEVKRLNVIPETPFCITCAKDIESQ
jgi:RNA polymerase-binding transcription factor DksA